MTVMLSIGQDAQVYAKDRKLRREGGWSQNPLSCQCTGTMAQASGPCLVLQICREAADEWASHNVGPLSSSEADWLLIDPSQFRFGCLTHPIRTKFTWCTPAISSMGTLLSSTLDTFLIIFLLTYINAIIQLELGYYLFSKVAMNIFVFARTRRLFSHSHVHITWSPINQEVAQLAHSFARFLLCSHARGPSIATLNHSADDSCWLWRFRSFQLYIPLSIAHPGQCNHCFRYIQTRSAFYSNNRRDNSMVEHLTSVSGPRVPGCCEWIGWSWFDSRLCLFGSFITKTRNYGSRVHMSKCFRAEPSSASRKLAHVQ